MRMRLRPAALRPEGLRGSGRLGRPFDVASASGRGCRAFRESRANEINMVALAKAARTAFKPSPRDLLLQRAGRISFGICLAWRDAVAMPRSSEWGTGNDQ